MKKHLTLFVITLSIAIQKMNAQLDMVFISGFSVTSNSSNNSLAWTVTNNQGAKYFFIERCVNGNDFKTIATVKVTAKFGAESYKYSDTVANPDRIQYRLRIESKTQNTFYSRTIITRYVPISDYDIKILGNPLRDRLSFQYSAKDAQKIEMTIYSLSGKILLNQKKETFKGSNSITIPLPSAFAPGMYVVEVINGMQSLAATFIKQ